MFASSCSRRQGWLLAIAVMTLGCGSAHLEAPSPSAPSALLDRPLPEVRRPTVQGASVAVSGGSGKVVVVKFFAEYCKPCQQTLPAAEALRQRHPDVVWLGISEDETLEAAIAQVRRYGLGFPVVLDRGHVLRGRFRVDELPMTFVADRRGNVIWVGDGRHDETDLARAIQRASQ